MAQYVITGTLESMSRAMAYERIRLHGDTFSTRVTHETDFLVVGQLRTDITRKLLAADKFGIPVIHESELMYRLGEPVQLQWNFIY